MLHDCDQGWVGGVRRQLDRQNRVIESGIRRCIWTDSATRRIDDNVVRINPDLAQHRSQQRGFVLAVAVAVRVYLGSRMRLKSSNSEFNRYIPDVFLNKSR